MEPLEPETYETLAREAKKRKQGCCCGLGCLGMVLLFILSLSSIGPHESTLRLGCTNNAKRIMLGLHVYHDKYKSLLPAYSTDENGKPLHSWRVLILPYIEQYELYKQIRLDEPWDSKYNRQFHDKMPSCYWCPSAFQNRSIFSTRDTDKTGMTCYMRVVGPGTTTTGADAISLADVKAVLSQSVALVEVYPTVNWMAPVDVSPEDLATGINRKKKQGIGSFHYGGMNIAMLDGSVDYVPDAEVPALAEKAIIPQE